MSEKYESGIAYYEAQQREEWQREQPVWRWSLWEKSSRIQKLEEEFYANPKSTHAMEAAILAMERKMSAITTMVQKTQAQDLEDIFIKGDIASMNELQRIDYVRRLCLSLGLNPLTQPFEYMSLQGRLMLYAKKSCTEQLRTNRCISLKILSEINEEGVYIVKAQASTPDGRTDEDIGAVSIQGLAKEALCNAKMKAVTKAKRRVTLSICGLGFLDESELETTSAKKVEKEIDDPKISKDELTKLYALAKEAGIQSKIEINEMSVEMFGHPTMDLTSTECGKLCFKLTNIVPKVEVVDDPRMVK